MYILCASWHAVKTLAFRTVLVRPALLRRCGFFAKFCVLHTGSAVLCSDVCETERRTVFTHRAMPEGAALSLHRRDPEQNRSVCW